MSIRYFLFVSSLLLFASCSRYPQLQPDSKTAQLTRETIRPKIEKSLYRCNVAGRVFLKKFQISGIVYLVQSDEQETHVLFQNEMGLSYFHFIWDQQNNFRVVSIIAQMNKPALIKTLKKDFEMILLSISSSGSESFYRKADNSSILRIPLTKGFVDYSYNSTDKTWMGGMLVDKRKVITEINFAAPTAWQTLPDALRIRHRTAGFTIHLKKLNSNDTE